MPYNQDLEYRIEKLLGRYGDISKKKMFGGVCYLLNGNMCFGIYKEYLILRTSEEKAKKLLENDYAKPFDITGRPMKGWVMISPDYVETDVQLESMLKMGSDFVKQLPAK